ncbi:MAG: hypothetical protein M3Q40_01485 [Pseudomonadota bacterium]|nr:hypothetical protein [Pseudomonadota bacterium]
MAYGLRFLASALVGAGLLLAAPLPAQAQSQGDDVARVIVDVADVIFRAGQPYERHGRYNQYDPLVVGRDRYGRPIYERNPPRQANYGRGHGRGYGDGYGHPGAGHRQTHCDRNGRCTVTYYDPAQDRRHGRASHGGRYGYDPRGGAYRQYDRNHGDRHRYPGYGY